MYQLSYPARLSPEAKGYFTVRFPAVPEAITSGRNLRAALSEAADCLSVAPAGRITDGADITIPSRPRKGQYLVQVPLYLARKIGLYSALRERSMNNSQLARRLNVSETVVRRLLNPRHDSKPEKIQAALEAFGKRLVVTCGARFSVQRRTSFRRGLP